MKLTLQHITFLHRNTSETLSYEVYGKPLHSAPIVLVNHALTGNSTVCGKEGWWQNLIGIDKAIDANKYTVLAFNIPGNGYDGVLINDYKSTTVKNVAELFLAGLSALKIKSVFAIIGGSLGGGITWQMATIQPEITTHIIPIASHYKSSDWIIANCLIQEQFLLNSKKPVHDARLHAMLCYRTPESFKARFNRSINENLKMFNVESWLLHHGEKLQARFQLSAYKAMNHLLRTIDVDNLKKIQAQITLISVNTDLFFTAKDINQSYKELKKLGKNVVYHEIESIHGHDAFLIEYEQIKKSIKHIFN